MEKDKSRGLKHIKDKRKYKGNSVKLNKHVPPKIRPNLGSNCDRYEKDECDMGDTVLTSATDFSLLANKPISSGSYYTFKTDEIDNNVTENKVNTELFSLDLNRIHDSICSVPFHMRIGCGNKYFSQQDIKDMEKDAKYFKKRCNRQLVVTYDNTSDIQETSTEQSERLEPCVEECKIVEDGLSTLRPDDTNNNKENLRVNKTDSENDDLEQWLEDILDD